MKGGVYFWPIYSFRHNIIAGTPPTWNSRIIELNGHKYSHRSLRLINDDLPLSKPGGNAGYYESEFAKLIIPFFNLQEDGRFGLGSKDRIKWPKPQWGDLLSSPLDQHDRYFNTDYVPRRDAQNAYTYSYWYWDDRGYFYYNTERRQRGDRIVWRPFLEYVEEA